MGSLIMNSAQASRPSAAPSDHPPGASSQVRLMGLAIDAYTPQQVIQRLIAASAAGTGGYLMTPNLDNLRSLKRSDQLMTHAQAADVRVADGMPLIWASRIQGTPLPARVPGSDLILSLADAAAQSGRRVYLLGGEPGTAHSAAEALRRQSPGIEIVGTHCPPWGFEHDPAELARIRAGLLAARPDFVYVGLPFPKASVLIAEMRPSLPQTWFLGLGISFSFVCGNVPRAPAWMQRAGLEWLHRLRQEPRRLARRYLLEGLPFAVNLFWAALVARRQSRRRGDPQHADGNSPSSSSHEANEVTE
jgi:N-acetylglucosaminyldiphosphoundecaprenol N-acetyl-beta-D-mannosaminyltransferase